MPAVICSWFASSLILLSQGPSMSAVHARDLNVFAGDGTEHHSEETIGQ